MRETLVLTDAFSIRTPLQGALADFIRRSGFECVHTEELARDFTCQLAAYVEEEVPCFPEIFILPSSAHLPALVPGTKPVIIGSVSMGGPAATRVLKECATLATGGWAVFVAKASDAVPMWQYGLILARKDASASTAEEAMMEGADSVPALLIRNRGRLVVELLNSRALTFTVSLTAEQVTASPLAGNVQLFVEAASEAVTVGDVGKFKAYLRRLLIDMLQHCHGTLLAVHAVPLEGTCPLRLKDGVWLIPPLPLAEAHAATITARDAESLSVLQSYEALLRGMINCDGVVIFGANGTILGYRVFLRPDATDGPAGNTDGGGRRRTFALMSSRLGPDLRAAFIRSQDGSTECKRNPQ